MGGEPAGQSVGAVCMIAELDSMIAELDSMIEELDSRAGPRPEPRPASGTRGCHLAHGPDASVAAGGHMLNGAEGDTFFGGCVWPRSDLAEFHPMGWDTP